MIERSRKINAVVVNYKSESEVKSLIDSLRALTYPVSKIIVVDNNSPDGSGERLKAKFADEQHYFILSPENNGFAAGINLGAEVALKDNPDGLWILNPDVIPSSDSLEILVGSLEKLDWKGAVGPKILYPKAENESLKIWGAGGFVDFSRGETLMRGSGEQDFGQFNEECGCDYLPGCALLIAKESFLQTGAMPEDYFLYFEETDWCQRIANLGLPLRYIPSAVVTHNFEDKKLAGALVTYYYNRNRRLFFFRYGDARLKCRIFLKTLLKDYPEALKAKREAHERNLAAEHAIFRAHERSCTDFLLRRVGKQDFA